MRHIPRREYQVARIQPEYLSTDFNGKLPFDCVEPLVLLEMDVARRTTPAHVAVLEQEERSRRILRRYLPVCWRPPGKYKSLTLAVFS
jgi:hypothetical protein